jgi:hypothetical protein
MIPTMSSSVPTLYNFAAHLRATYDAQSVHCYYDMNHDDLVTELTELADGEPASFDAVPMLENIPRPFGPSERVAQLQSTAAGSHSHKRRTAQRKVAKSKQLLPSSEAVQRAISSSKPIQTDYDPNAAPVCKGAYRSKDKGSNYRLLDPKKAWEIGELLGAHGHLRLVRYYEG